MKLATAEETATRRNPNARNPCEVDLVVLGPGGVGKSCLSVQFVISSFQDEYDPTIDDSYRRQVHVDDEVAIVNISDTAGQEDYRVVLDQRIREGEGFLLVFDVTNPKTLEEARDFKNLIDRIFETRQAPPVVLCANKVDLEEQRKVTKEECRAAAEELGATLIETSAFTRTNVDEAFFAGVRMVREQRAAGTPATAGKKRARRNSWPRRAVRRIGKLFRRRAAAAAS